MKLVLCYLAAASPDLSEPDLRSALTTALPTAVGENLMPTLAETWEKKGLQQGTLTGERLAYVNLARVRFGEVTAEELADVLAALPASQSLAPLAQWILEANTGNALLVRVRKL